ncbi:MAG: hypothetical protein CMJ89_13775 [Planctomycetes bacterium]|nr:hypothetical protein [Planctomycetota bacterium]
MAPERRRACTGIALLLALSAFAPSRLLHPDSLSRTRIEIDGGKATVHVSFQALSLIEAIGALDVDDNLELSPEEVESGRESIGSYFVERLRFLLPSPSGDISLLEGRMEELSFLPEALVGPGFLQWMKAELVYHNPAGALERFDLELLFFRELNPLHADITSVTFAGEAPLEFYFSRTDLRHRVEAPRLRRPVVLREFMHAGFLRVVHVETLGILLAFSAAALVFGSWRRVFLVFLLAQFATYCAGAFGWIDYPPRLVTLAAALSIAYVSAENMLTEDRGGLLWEAGGFGLLLGASVAGSFGDRLQTQPLATTACLGYGLGFFLGSVVAIALLARLVNGWGRITDPQRAARILSATTIVLGLVLFLRRAGWL